MKRLFIVLLILVTIIFTACKRQSASKQDGKISVTAAAFPLYDIARHSIHNISKRDFENGAAYLNLMWKNTKKPVQNLEIWRCKRQISTLQASSNRRFAEPKNRDFYVY
jgi:hypothetical protein